MQKKTIRDIEVGGKRVLVRVDLNVPLNKESSIIADDARIRAVLPTIEYLIGNKAKVILCSHLGRPGGIVVDELRLTPVSRRLSQLLGQPVMQAGDCIGDEVERVVGRLREGEVLLLENLRFHAGEGENDPAFAQALSHLADIYIDDAFGSAHRAHASIVGVASYLPAVAGFLLEKELKIMGEALNAPIHPFAALIGGAKVSDKIGVLRNILPKVDSLLLGGGMACTFLKAKGYEVGLSLVEEDKLSFARELLEKSTCLLLPLDVVTAQRFETNAPLITVPIAEVPENYYIMDIGPQTIRRFAAELQGSKTVIWNGPMGVYEMPPFAEGTKAIARFLASLKDAITIIGGGSTAEVVEEVGLTLAMTHVSTGGGASLRFLEGETLPGVAVLMDKEK